MPFCNWHGNGKGGGFPPFLPPSCAHSMKLPAHTHFLFVASLGVLLSCTGDSPTRATGPVSTEDRTPPKLTALSLAPASVDVTSASATVVFTLSLEDAGAGVELFTVMFAGPGQSSGPSCTGGSLVSGSRNKGIWTCTATIPRGAAQGAWGVPLLILRDYAGNQVTYTTSQLLAAGFPTAFTVVGSGAASTLPQMTALSFSPDPADVSTSDVTVDIVFSVKAAAGVKEAYAYVETARGEPQYAQATSCSATTPSSGTTTSGTWKCALRIRKSSAAGTWTVNTLWVQDNAGNSTGAYNTESLAAAGFPSSFQVVSRTEDLASPTLTALSVSPSTVSVARGTAWVTFTITATDPGTGFARVQASLNPPGSPTGTGCVGDDQIPGPLEGVTLGCSVPVPGSAAAGAWSINNVLLIDAVGNFRTYSTAQLRAAGFPFEVTVTR